MPVSTQIERLRTALEPSFAGRASVLGVDLHTLEGVERELVLDAMVAGDPSPFVLVNGSLVCTGAVDVRAVLDALATTSAGGGRPGSARAYPARPPQFLKAGAIRMDNNLGTVDRVIRGVLGVALVAVGLSLMNLVLALILVPLGALLIYSGSIGFCNVYKVFHIDTSKRG
jgi:hypothetical protein